MKNGIINLDLTQPIKSANEFNSILLIMQIIDVGNILDSFDCKVGNYIKRVEDLTSPEQAEMMREEYKVARSKGMKIRGRDKIMFQTDGSKDEEGVLKTWSSSFNQDVHPTAY